MENLYSLFTMGIPDIVTVITDEKTYISRGQKNPAEEGLTRVEFLEQDNGQTVSVTSRDSLRFVKLRWNYRIKKQAQFLTDAWERGYGDLCWRGMSGGRCMPWYFLAAEQEKTLCFGVKVRPSAMGFWQADTKGITLFLDLRCGGNGVLLAGRTLKAAEIVCMEGPAGNTFETAREFCRRMCTDPVLPDFPVYGSNNWYYAYGESSDREILSDTDYLLSLTSGVSNPPFMVIDDGWQENHRINEYNGGPWKRGNGKFPDMKALAEKMKEKGVRPGIWVRLLLNEDRKIPGEWRISHNGCLDPSHPEALRYIREDVERICSWGYQLIKHDFSTFDLFGKWGFETNFQTEASGWNFYDRGKTGAEIVKQLYEEIFRAASEYHAVIIGCNTIGHLGAGLMHLNRTGDDTSGRMWERTRRMGINTLAFRLPQHGTFYHVDADCVGINGPIPWEKNRQWADVIVQSGTPLFISVKPGILPEHEKEELHQLMQKAARQDSHKIPADWMETDCPEVWIGGGETVVYDWFEEEGLGLDGRLERVYAPVPVP